MSSSKKIETKAGECRLCRCFLPLFDSHIIPKGVYRRLAKSNGVNNEHLVRVDKPSDKALLISDQLHEKLLCSKCEARLKNGGEDYFFQLIDETGKSRLNEAAKRSSASKGGDVAAPQGLDHTGVDVLKIAHFILGVLWRCNVSSLEGLAAYRGALGRKFSLEIERFLLGTGSFPEKCMIQLSIDNSDARMHVPSLSGKASEAATAP